MRTVLIWCLILLAAVMTAQAIPITVDTVEVDEVLLLENSSTRLDLERGDDIRVRIKITANANLDNVEILGFISGFEFNDIIGERISDVTQLFDLQANVSYVRTITLPLPSDAEVDDYKLRIIVSDRFGAPVIANFNFKIDTQRRNIKIQDVILSPGHRIKSGSALLAKVRIENKGQRDERDIKVVVTVPALGLSATDYIDEIRDNDRQDETEELFLRIPQCAEPGVYKVIVDAFYADNRRRSSVTRDIEVLKNPVCDDDEPLPGVRHGN